MPEVACNAHMDVHGPGEHLPPIAGLSSPSLHASFSSTADSAPRDPFADPASSGGGGFVLGCGGRDLSRAVRGTGRRPRRQEEERRERGVRHRSAGEGTGSGDFLPAPKVLHFRLTVLLDPELRFSQDEYDEWGGTLASSIEVAWKNLRSKEHLLQCGRLSRIS
ncbi:hypothetical protein DFH11DRAFT_1734359 [Phellopilus nigrolimitatus]|nr:hypothetical protein DFH11DRAFT_1734359 [Phellopilus nigrolimitatus]